MTQTRFLGAPAYFMGLVLVLFPLAESVLVVLPVRAGEVSWRFGATGLLSRALITPLLGILLVLAAALLLDHRRVLRVIAIISAVGALVLAGLIALFVLDALQMRAQVPPEAKTSFDLATISSAVKQVVTVALLAVFARAGWKASRSVPGARATTGSRTADLLVTAPRAE
jgi:hypothetical protein